MLYVTKLTDKNTYVILHLRLVLAFVTTLIVFKLSNFVDPSSSGHFTLKQTERNGKAREFLSSRAKVV